jgi:uncharacterized membrane-anchored protein YitT (DUF2179 family)
VAHGSSLVVTAPKPAVRELANAGLIILGILAAGMGLNGFLVSSNFIDGGVTGISMLLAKVSGLSLPILLVLVNAPFVAVGYRQLGRAFAVRSTLAISGLAMAVALIPYPDVTPDLLLTAVFGGFFIGAGIGLAVRGGAVLDGTEIAALLLSKRAGILKVGDVILLFNAGLFLIAMSILGVEPALYSILTYLTAAKTLDFVLYGIDEFSAVTIMSERHDAIRGRIVSELGRGVTVYKAYGGVSGAEQDVLYCVVTRLEIGRLKAIVHELDPRAFVVVHVLAGAEGGTLARTRLH